MATTIERGTVVHYDPTQIRGQVQLKNKVISFLATSFHSGRPTRNPRVGDCVDVVFAGQAMLYINLRSSQDQR